MNFKGKIFAIILSLILIPVLLVGVSCGQKDQISAGKREPDVENSPLSHNKGETPKKELVKTEAATIVDFEDDVSVKKSGQEGWRKASQGQKLNPGDELKTGKTAFCMIFLSEGTTLKVGNDTRVEIKKLQRNSSRFSIVVGKIWINVSRVLDKKTVFEVEAPHILAAVKGTVFEVRCSNDVDTILVYDGSVIARYKSEEKDVREKQKIACSKDGFISQPVAINTTNLNRWQKWNIAIDTEIDNLREKSVLGLVAQHRETPGASTGERVPPLAVKAKGSPEANISVSKGLYIKQIRGIVQKHENPFK